MPSSTERLTRSATEEENAIQKTIEKVLSNVSFLNKIMETISTKIDTYMANHMKLYQEQLSTMQEELDRSNSRLDQLEQYSRLDSVRLFGLPEKSNENITEEVISILSTKLKLNIKHEDISICHRLNAREDGIKPVIIKFVRKSTKNEVYNAKSRLKGSQLIVREDLTKPRASMISDNTSSDSSWSSMSDDSSDEEFAMQQLKVRNENYCTDTIPQYTDEVFFEHFRVTRPVVEDLCEGFSQSEYFHSQSGRYGKITAKEHILIFLWFAGHQTASFRDVADRFDIALSALFKVIRRVTYYLSNMSRHIIQWPSVAEQVIIEQQFANNDFPGVIGAIDGTHIKIDQPKNDPESYFNRKQYYSIQLRKVDDIVHFIRACCVLHNIALDNHFEAIEEQEHEPDIVEDRNNDGIGNAIRDHVANMLPL
ncbi:l1 transposable element-related [Holotrichia oblita]|uniref:L1 transposable element-related n=1 Tax=Holotrichia oblita TaxID=644536 RepID=A0ACB9TDN1_HOLOL|nr:l1 transposable element-related [Holotrichia oblita]